MSVEHGQFQPCDILSVELVKAVVYVSSYFLKFFCYFVIWFFLAQMENLIARKNSKYKQPEPASVTQVEVKAIVWTLKNIKILCISL